jgi:hypothetical protein
MQWTALQCDAITVSLFFCLHGPPNGGGYPVMTLPREEWRLVPGFDGYEVSSLGRVRSWRSTRYTGRRLRTPKVLRPIVTPVGYHQISLRRDGRNFRTGIHRLVLLAWAGPCPPGYQGAHLDGCPENNVPANLQWASAAENTGHKRRHGTFGHKLTDAQVSEIRRRWQPHRYGLVQALAREFGVSPDMIGHIVGGRSWEVAS